MGSKLRVPIAVLLSVATGCASVIDDQRSSVGASGAASVIDSAGEAGEAGSSAGEGGSAGEASRDSGSELGGYTAAQGGSLGARAGAPAVAVAGHEESGTRLCTDPRDCRGGLTCTASEGSSDRACLAACESDADCRSDERCFEREGLQKRCFQSCQDSPEVCDYEFDCADYYRTLQYICLPRFWVRSWPPIQK